jgi:hypothetical protein
VIRLKNIRSKTYRVKTMNIIKLILISTFSILASFAVQAEAPIFINGFEAPTERDAPAALCNSTNGDNWMGNTNWLVGDP